MQQILQKESHKALYPIYIKKANTCMIYYVVKWMKTLSLAVSSFTSNYLPYCFSLLPELLNSKPFWNKYIHCEIIDHCCNVFFVEIQLKKEHLKNVFWVPEFGCPDWYTGLPNSLNMSLVFNTDRLDLNFTCFKHRVSLFDALLQPKLKENQ